MKLLLLIFLPLVLLWLLTESRPVKIQRMRRLGRTWQQIADRYGVSISTARRWSVA